MGIRIDVITGFLGSGKTTWIQQLLGSVLNKNRIAIIENEFGAINIDGAILKEKGGIVRELPSGCICCTLSGSLQDTVVDLLENVQPNRIIIEPTGVAELDEILKVLHQIKIDKELDIYVSTIVDPETFDECLENLGLFYTSQIAGADLIVLSRTQEIDNNLLDICYEKLVEINPKGVILTMPWQDINEEIIEELYLGKPPVHVQLKKDNKTLKDNQPLGQGLKFQMVSSEIKEPYDRIKMKEFVQLIQDGVGQIWRVKGLFQDINGQWLRMDWTPGVLKFENIAVQDKSGLTIIGCNLNKERIKELWPEK